MKCFIGIAKKLEDNAMFYREPQKQSHRLSRSSLRITYDVIVGQQSFQPRFKAGIQDITLSYSQQYGNT